MKEIKEDIVYFRNTILALFFALLFVVCIGATLANNNSERFSSGEIHFNKEIKVEITEKDIFENAPTVLVGTGSSGLLEEQRTLWPGCTLKGVTLATKVSREDQEDNTDLAYLRVKLDIMVDDVVDMTKAGLIYLDQDPNGDVWYPVDFSTKKDGSDVWYVLCSKENATKTNGDPYLKYTARPAKQNETVYFIKNSNMVVDRKMDNTYAGRTLNVNFTSQVVQKSNIEPSRIFSMNEDGEIESAWWADIVMEE